MSLENINKTIDKENINKIKDLLSEYDLNIKEKNWLLYFDINYNWNDKLDVINKRIEFLKYMIDNTSFNDNEKAKLNILIDKIYENTKVLYDTKKNLKNLKYPEPAEIEYESSISYLYYIWIPIFRSSLYDYLNDKNEIVNLIDKKKLKKLINDIDNQIKNSNFKKNYDEYKKIHDILKQIESDIELFSSINNRNSTDISDRINKNLNELANIVKNLENQWIKLNFDFNNKTLEYKWVKYSFDVNNKVYFSKERINLNNYEKMLIDDYEDLINEFEKIKNKLENIKSINKDDFLKLYEDIKNYNNKVIIFKNKYNNYEIKEIEILNVMQKNIKSDLKKTWWIALPIIFISIWNDLKSTLSEWVNLIPIIWDLKMIAEWLYGKTFDWKDLNWWNRVTHISSWILWLVPWVWILLKYGKWLKLFSKIRNPDKLIQHTLNWKYSIFVQGVWSVSIWITYDLLTNKNGK